MSAALAALALAPGLAVGSFLTVVAARVPVHESIVRPRSACPACDALIAWYDNVPLVSYVALRGRCRHCAASIPARYPLTELLTAALVVACVLRFGPTLEALTASVFCAVLVVISVIDVEHRIVPNRIVLPAAALVLALQLVRDPRPEWPLAALAASGCLFVVALAYPKGLGMGDVKLALLLGAMLGWSVVVALGLGIVAALVPAAWLLVRHGSRARKMGIPFAPFLAFGGVVALFAGPAILDWYLGLGG